MKAFTKKKTTQKQSKKLIEQFNKKKLGSKMLFSIADSIEFF